MLPTNDLGRIGRQLILLDETLSEKYGENEAIQNLQKSLCPVQYSPREFKVSDIWRPAAELL